MIDCSSNTSTFDTISECNREIIHDEQITSTFTRFSIQSVISVTLSSFDILISYNFSIFTFLFQKNDFN